MRLTLAQLEAAVEFCAEYGAREVDIDVVVVNVNPEFNFRPETTIRRVTAEVQAEPDGAAFPARWKTVGGFYGPGGQLLADLEELQQ